MSTKAVDNSTILMAIDKSTIYDAVETNIDPAMEMAAAYGIIDDDGLFHIVGDDGERIQYDH